MAKEYFLKFDDFDQYGEVISKDCEITLPGSSFIYKNFDKTEPPIGICSLQRDEKGIFSNNILFYDKDSGIYNSFLKSSMAELTISGHILKKANNEVKKFDITSAHIIGKK